MRDIKDKLKKLFRVAQNDASTDGEIENAMRAASILMSKHQLTREDVVDNDDGTFDIRNVSYSQANVYSMYTSICSWESLLARFITGFVPTCRWYYARKQERRNHAGMVVGNKKATEITFYGPDEDIAFCCDLWNELTGFITAAASLRWGSGLSRGDAASYAEGFMRGLIDANRKETLKLTQQAQASPGYALVVVNKQKAISEGALTWLKETEGIRFKVGSAIKSRAGKSTNAYNQGKQDGAGYDVGTRPAPQKRLT